VAAADERNIAQRTMEELRYTARLRVLPSRVAWFQLRARLLALRTNDQFSLVSVTRPENLARLLSLARDHRLVVELGTATGWTTLSLALSDSGAEVVSYDPFPHPERERYLRLVGPRTLNRIAFVHAPGATGPRDDRRVDLLYIDSSHSRDATIEEVNAWSPVLGPGSVIAFDDYGHTEYPGVREAVEELGLSGAAHGPLFVHRV
jgi:predicted O-methyltransferase YrrM